MRQRIDGVCHVYTKNDGSCFVLPRSEYSRIRSDWMQGKAFFEGTGFYGSGMTIRLGDVVAVADTPASAMQAQRADNSADSFEDSLP